MECTEMIKLEMIEIVGKWQWAKDYVCPVMRPVKEDMNEYAGMPSISFLDLKVYYKILYPLSEGNMATVKVTDALLKVWGISKAELHKNAAKNLKKDGYQIRDMMSICREMLGGETDVDSVDMKADMYVMQNSKKAEGAAGMLLIDMIREFAENRGSDLYILPSSIHETILIPFGKKICPEMLREMVKEVNKSQVEEKEQLGNSIYAFSRESGKIYIAL